MSIRHCWPCLFMSLVPAVPLPLYAGDVGIVVVVRLDSTIYQRSDFGEPPQLAVWLENSLTNEIRTLFVTRRTARGDFEGAVNRPVSLPVWIGVYRRESGRTDFPSPRRPAPDEITGATPQHSVLEVHARLPEGSRWWWFMEMNVSGDYTIRFPAADDNGHTDLHGNGQPSLTYRGELTVVPGYESRATLMGRSDQYDVVTQPIQDLTGIESARSVITECMVRVNDRR